MNGCNVIKTGTVWWVVPLLFLLFFPLSCNKTQPLKGKELARINDRVITLEEFEQEMEQLPQLAKLQMVSDEGRKDFLQELIKQELLLQEAEKRGLDKDKEILANLEILKNRLIINALAQELCAGKDEVSDDEVEAYYREHKEEFFLERVRVRHIMVKTLQEAKEIKKRLYQGEDFVTLAKQYSIWPYTKQKGGDLGYIERGMVDKAFEQAAFSLARRGELSDIVKTTFGYHIIRLEDKIGPRQRAFSEVQEEIRNRLRNKKREKILTAHLQELREGAQIIINEELLLSEEEEGS
jgi:parvulin-like peptidyl-prolyl isomerase